MPYPPSAENVLRSAWMPAPPLGSDPAIVSRFGIIGAAVRTAALATSGGVSIERDRERHQRRRQPRRWREVQPLGQAGRRNRPALDVAGVDQLVRHEAASHGTAGRTRRRGFVGVAPGPPSTVDEVTHHEHREQRHEDGADEVQEVLVRRDVDEQRETVATRPMPTASTRRSARGNRFCVDTAVEYTFANDSSSSRATSTAEREPPGRHRDERGEHAELGTGPRWRPS